MMAQKPSRNIKVVLVAGAVAIAALICACIACAAMFYFIGTDPAVVATMTARAVAQTTDESTPMPAIVTQPTTPAPPTETREPTSTAIPTATLIPETATAISANQTITARADWIVDVPAIIGVSRGDIEKQLGSPTEVAAVQAGTVEELPQGGQTRVYKVGRYSIYINYSPDRIARGVLLVDGLQEDKYSLDDWPEIIRRLGLGTVGSPQEFPAARNWSNANGFNIQMNSDGIGGIIVWVKVYRP